MTAFTYTVRLQTRWTRPPDDIYIYYFEGRLKPEYEKFVDFSSDLVIANIHCDITRRLMDTKGFWEKKWVILSGLLRSLSVKITSQLPQSPVKIINQWNHEGIWHTFLRKTS